VLRRLAEAGGLPHAEKREASCSRRVAGRQTAEAIRSWRLQLRRSSRWSAALPRREITEIYEGTSEISASRIARSIPRPAEAALASGDGKR
jgi:hypothetical protein